MKTFVTILLILAIPSLAFAPGGNVTKKDNDRIIKKELLYDGVWGTIYHAEEKQCDESPTKTGNGSLIITERASKHRWIAITQYMLKDDWRRGLALKRDSSDTRFNGKIEYGDTIWIESPYPELNGWWVVNDTKNKRFEDPTIDFLQTKDDGTLYGNNPQWSGKWEDIKIFKYQDNV